MLIPIKPVSKSKCMFLGMILLILLNVLNRIYCRDAIAKSCKWDFLTQIACAESNKTGLQV